MCSHFPSFYFVEEFNDIQKTLDESVQAVLNGITQIPKYGSPGSLLPVGANTRALLTDNDEYNTVMIIGMYGNGRFFIAGQNGYVEAFKTKEDADIAKFFDNVKQFLCPNGCSAEEIICIDKTNDIPESAKLLVWNGHSDKSDSVIKLILSFLNNGGSIFCGSTAWGWQQLNDYKSLEQFQFANFTAQLGVILKTDATYSSAPYNVSKSKHEYGNFVLTMNRIRAAQTPDIGDVECASSVFVEFNKYNVDCTDVLISQVIECLNTCKPSSYPCQAKPLNDQNDITLVNVFSDLMSLIPMYAAPGISNFPGQYTNGIPLTSEKIKIHSQFKEWNSTGLYAPAGQLINCIILEGKPNQWNLRIGSHTDNLKGKKPMKRWPTIVVQKELADNLNFSSPYGGLIYLESKKPDVSLRIQISGACPAPYYDLTMPKTTKDWQYNRKKEGLWAEIAGKHVIFTIPSVSVQDLADPYPMIKLWDEVIECHHYLRGTNPSSSRRERIVADLQPGAGYMHSGYPIVTHLDITEKETAGNIFDVEYIRKKGAWGLFHEIGHNMQRAAWTFSGSTEVTVNWFSLHACLKISHQEPWTCDWMNGQKESAKKYLLSGSDFDEWKSKPGVALCIYAELFRDFGVENFRQVLIVYEKMKPEDLPEKDQDKIDRFILEFSLMTKRNLAPGFILWGFPVSKNIVDKVSKYPEWTPRDEVTEVLTKK